jgi:hypothetical protein
MRAASYASVSPRLASLELQKMHNARSTPLVATVGELEVVNALEQCVTRKTPRSTGTFLTEDLENDPRTGVF